MLTYDDCLDLCELSQEEIDAIAEHEHCQRLQALAKAEYLVHTPGGELKIRRMILDDIRHAQQHGDRQHEMELKRVLACFIKNHPQHGAQA
ncbi:hypothetical protein [Motiliproteus sp. SC1-56]|uniref:hypothetical protein n=1 Tax=Motiliproteus sp. SC1-56 TaxID=2799565 RepID=UPI001A909B8F|nr:hypothetical protein [Motiliproteus sp. SC1-56]